MLRTSLVVLLSALACELHALHVGAPAAVGARRATSPLMKGKRSRGKGALRARRL
jgi:hypothetical protein